MSLQAQDNFLFKVEMQRLKKINDDAFERILNKAGKEIESPIPTWSLQEEAELDGKPFSFPHKDRSKSRTRYHASKRDKGKHYNKKYNEERRDFRLYYSGFNYSKGKSHNQDFLEYMTDIDLKSYKNDFINGNETINHTEDKLADCFFSVKYPTNPYKNLIELDKEIKILFDKGIEISKETRTTLVYSLFRRERKLQIDNKCPIIGYSVYQCDYPDDGLKGTYPTREIAEEVIKSLVNKFPEFEQDYYILPVRTYTAEQVKEIKLSGFLPVAGIIEA